MKRQKRFLGIFLAACLLISAFPLRAAAADILPYATCGGYLGVNRYTGTLEHATNLKGDLVIPKTIEGITVTALKDDLFYGFEDLTSVTVPDTVSVIGDRAFGACTSLRSVDLGKGVTHLGKGAFRYCYSLRDVKLSPELENIESHTFASCIALESITLPEKVVSVGSYAFSECEKLSSVSMSDGVTTIGDYGFANCTSLEEISLPKSLDALNTALFNGCSALSKVTVPPSVKSVGKSAFGACVSLQELRLPEGVEKIYDWAFNGCEALSSISMPDSITSIGADSFYGCDNISFLVNPGSLSQVYASANHIPFKIGTLDPDDPPVDPPVVETPFLDIENHWGKEYIGWAYSKGYFKGITEARFGPNVAVNRGMIVSVLYRMAGEPAVQTSASFSDVAATAYYAQAVSWGQASKVIEGMGGGKFSPTRNVTREQLATMLYRFAGYRKLDTSKRGDLNGFKDSEKVSSYAGEALSWAIGSGVVTGRTGAVLDPQGNATRAEAAAMLQRFDALK